MRAKEQTKLDVRLEAWAAPDDPREPESGHFPFVFDLPELTTSLPRLPAAATVQLALFAYEFAWHSDDEAFAASQTEPAFAPESFVPSGMFVEDGPPEAAAFFHGHLVEGGIRENETTSRPFWAGLVRTLGGEVDVVADLELLDGEPSPGAVVSVTGWLTGRLKYVDSSGPPPRSGLLSRLRRR